MLKILVKGITLIFEKKIQKGNRFDLNNQLKVGFYLKC